MRIAKAARKNPRELAQALVAALPKNALVASAEVAGAGFINFRLEKDAWFAALKTVAAQGAAYGRSNVGAGRKVMVEFVSANPTGPMHVGHGRGAAYGATLGNLLEATGHHGLSRVLHQRRRPADRHPRGQCLPAIPRAQRRKRNVPVERLSRRLHPARGARAACETRRCAAGAPRPTSPSGAPPDAPGRRQGQTHRRAHREFAPLLGAEEFDSIVIFARDQMMADIRNDLEEFGVRFDCWYSERELNKSGAIDAAFAVLRASGPRVHERRRRVVQVHRIRRRRRPRRGARQRREDLLRLRHRLSLRQAAARTRTAHRRLGCGSSRLRVARARRVGRARQTRRLLRSVSHAAGEPVPRRREAVHGQARGQFRDAARPAQRGRQRRLPLFLPDAQPRPGARFRPGAREVTLQREPGVLHPVRACARARRS